MGLFDGLGTLVTDALNGRPINILAVAEDIFQNAGGVNGILAQLNQAGLGDQVKILDRYRRQFAGFSGADKIRSFNEQLRSLANAFGVDLDSLPQLLAQYLPEAVDKASPNGVLPS